MDGRPRRRGAVSGRSRHKAIAKSAAHLDDSSGEQESERKATSAEERIDGRQKRHRKPRVPSAWRITEKRCVLLPFGCLQFSVTLCVRCRGCGAEGGGRQTPRAVGRCLGCKLRRRPDARASRLGFLSRAARAAGLVSWLQAAHTTGRSRVTAQISQPSRAGGRSGVLVASRAHDRTLARRGLDISAEPRERPVWCLGCNLHRRPDACASRLSFSGDGRTTTGSRTGLRRRRSGLPRTGLRRA